ncbi:uncharacterized protein LOC131882361 [Tigriopus californicus]|uniref:uncharacterized protein LOC131882361 n=1 Tax=Tigriopus californicus TaxID=6832 RepID=UPI0027D9DDE9|nr:uncharacterized protein LOC131882361 [Tigriopus californicus]
MFHPSGKNSTSTWQLSNQNPFLWRVYSSRLVRGRKCARLKHVVRVVSRLRNLSLFKGEKGRIFRVEKGPLNQKGFNNKMMHKTPLAQMLLTWILLSLVATTTAFECYTGNDDTMRSKQCPSFGAMKLDVCFKRTGDMSDDVQRGCFNSQIASFIIDDDKQDASKVEGCMNIPEKYGAGSICLCRSALCNGVQSHQSFHSIFLLVTTMTLLSLRYVSWT